MFSILELFNFGLCPTCNISVIVLRLKDINCLESETTVIEQSSRVIAHRAQRLHLHPEPNFQLDIKHVLAIQCKGRQYLVIAKHLSFEPEKTEYEPWLQNLPCMNFNNWLNLFKP